MFDSLRIRAIPCGWVVLTLLASCQWEGVHRAEPEPLAERVFVIGWDGAEEGGCPRVGERSVGAGRCDVGQTRFFKDGLGGFTDLTSCWTDHHIDIGITGKAFGHNAPNWISIA